MSSEKQIEANKINALKGGVKTEAGKEITKFNAQKHGILRQTITDLEKNIYSDILDQLNNELKPEGIVEEVLVEKIAIFYLRSFRVAKAESQFIKSMINPRIVKYTDDMPSDFIKVEKEGYTPKINYEPINNFGNVFLRYETTIENRLYKALHELERIQARRKGEKVVAPLSVDVNMGRIETDDYIDGIKRIEVDEKSIMKKLGLFGENEANKKP